MIFCEFAVICILNDSFKLTHDLYDNFEDDDFDKELVDDGTGK